MPYFPIMEKLEKTRKFYRNKTNARSLLHNNHTYRDNYERADYTHKYPTTIISVSNADRTKQLHPTQKPVELMEYLIKTYTNENELVLDFTCGSGSTLVGCLNTNRRGIGIELDEGYFNISKERIEKVRGETIWTK